MSIDFTGQSVLVTGGTKGLGRGIATAFLAAGADVVVCARNEPSEPVSSAGRQAHFLAVDIRDATQASAAVDAAAARLGSLDVVINNAGGSPPSPAAENSPRFVSAIVGLNLLAPFYIAQRANAVMQRQPGGGVILNIGSVSGARPSPGTAIYGAAKAGLGSLTTTLAMEWAPAVRVNLITVGLLRSAEASEHYGGAGGEAAAAATVPMGRMAVPSDVTAACLFLASQQAAYITGADVAVHGGGEPPGFLAAVSASLAT